MAYKFNPFTSTFDEAGSGSSSGSTKLLYRLNSTVAGANNTSSQSIFGVGVTLESNTVYSVTLSARFNKSSGTTSHSFATLFGGTATLNNALLHTISDNANSVSANTGGTSASYSIASDLVNSKAIEFALTNASLTITIFVTGTISVATGGTFIPQYILSSSPGGAYTTQAGSYVEFIPIGASGSNNSVGTWA